MVIKILDNIQKYLFLWIAGAIFSGLAVVATSGGYPFSPFICLLAALVMIYPSLVPLDFGKLKISLKDHKLIFISLFFNFLISPALALLLGYVFLNENPALWIGLILLSLLPGGGMATTWALKSRSDMPSIVGIVIFNLLAAILIAPAAISHTLDRMEIPDQSELASDVCPIGSLSGGVMSCGLGGGEMNSAKIGLAVFFIVVIPLIMAYISQKIIVYYKNREHLERLKPVFGKASNAGLILILFILMSLENNKIIFSNPELIAQSIFPLVWYYMVIGIMTFAVYRKFFNNSKGKALFWGTYLRYITLALGLAISFIFQDPNLSTMIIPIILSYFIQIPSSFWLAKHLKENI